eukprot:TRINITY_DN16550_c0_g1_i1.p1 TRINITY_DN16550_c0_g1~~TRINITY_DN16550_c0_g1_i1.p1  ORF type:complete len:112 (-),score=26.37 TRINITY_DN16550_c0_g1_i1:264-599(-)
MSDIESAKVESGEEDIGVIEEDESFLNEEGNGTMVKNGMEMKEVSWPPIDTPAKPDEMVNPRKHLPNLSGVVHIGKDRRQKMELEIQNFQGSTDSYSSNPFFQRGNFSPAR